MRKKLNWLRQTLEWGSPQRWQEGLADLIDADGNGGRVYVATPDGDVIDLQQGATALDFAYRIHTEIGHRCIAAEADGRPVALNQALRTGERLIVQTAAEADPKLLWLDPQLGFAKTARAREKIQAWLRNRPRALITDSAYRVIEQLRESIGVGRLSTELIEALCGHFGYADTEMLLLGVGVGELPLLEFGTELARRLLPIDTSDRQTQRIFVTGRDREGLLRDVALALSQRQLTIVATAAQVGPSQAASMHLDLSFAEPSELVAVLLLLPEVPGVTTVRCERP